MGEVGKKGRRVGEPSDNPERPTPGSLTTARLLTRSAGAKARDQATPSRFCPALLTSDTLKFSLRQPCLRTGEDNADRREPQGGRPKRSVSSELEFAARPHPRGNDTKRRFERPRRLPRAASLAPPTNGNPLSRGRGPPSLPEDQSGTRGNSRRNAQVPSFNQSVRLNEDLAMF